MKEIISEKLKGISIFGSLPQRYLKRLSSEFQIKEFKNGQTIFHQSDQSTDLYVIIKGSVKASLLNENGDELTLAEFKKGDFFGEMSLIDGKPRSATVSAIEDSVVAVLTRERFIEVLRKDPNISLELLSSIVERLRIANGLIESLAFFEVEERLINLLCLMVQECGDKTVDGFYKIKRCTHRELASRIGASREAVTKALKVLKFKGLIKEGEGGYIVSPMIFSKNTELKIKR